MALTKIPANLLDTSSGITLGDSKKIRLGDGPDLDIYHDGSNSYIEDLGDGVLFVKASSGIYFNGKTTDEPLARFIENGAVNLYYDNNLRIATSSAGATVDGTLTVTGNLDITGDINSYNVTDLDVTDKTITLGAGQTEANSGGSGIIIDGSSASILWDETNDEWDFNKKIHIGGETYFDAGTRHYTYDDQANFWSLYTNTDDTFRFNYNGSGDDEIVINTSGNVGIGETSPDRQLHLTGSGTNDARIKLENTSASYYAGLVLTASAKEFHVGVGGASVAAGYANSLYIHDATAGALRATIDTSGNVGIGVTPAAHSSLFTALDIDNTALTAFNDVVGIWEANTYYDGSNYKYRANGYAGQALINNGGEFQVKQAVSGTAGASATLVQNFTITNSGSVGIGETSPANLLHVKASDAGIAPHSSAQIVLERDGTNYLQFLTTAAGTSGLLFGDTNDIDVSKIYVDHNTTKMTFVSEASETMTLHGGNVGIGTSSPSSKLQIMGGTSGVDQISLSSNLSDNTTKYAGLVMTMYTNNTAALIGAKAENGNTSLFYGSSGSDHRGVTKHIWYTNSNYNSTSGNTERMRLDSLGSLIIGNTAEPTGSNGGGSAFITDSVGRRNLILATTSTGLIDIANFRNPNGTVGTIRTNGSSTSYYTSSDYRLKENVVTDWDATTRLKQLKPSRFNFIADGDTTLDGFLAHEVQDIVPEATHGTKDELDSDGNPEYQGIDHAKLVPLLTKALQEAITTIDDLKTRIETLEG